MIIEWRPAAYDDRDRIFSTISEENPIAAIELDEEFEEKTNALAEHPKLYKAGRVRDTREMVVRANYIVVYRELTSVIEIVRILHARQQWP